MAFTNQELNERREEGCFAITSEKKYYELDNVFIKRTLKSCEWQKNQSGELVVPRAVKQRLRNESDSIAYIEKNTSIPVPSVICTFEDDEASYILTKIVPGVSMAELGDRGEKKVVMDELKEHIDAMHSLRSNTIGGVSGLVCPPYRVTLRTTNDAWHLAPSSSEEYVFCHNDLSQSNIIVDPVTLKINAIIDWEYAGFYPEFFEGYFYMRPGPSAALSGEKDDSEDLLRFLEDHKN
jgi:hypothetical protein